MPGLELLIFGLTAAFLGGIAPSTLGFEPLDRQSSKTIPAVDSLFLVHRHSLFKDPFGSNAVKERASEALTNRSFDDQVEDLMDNPW